MYFNTLLLGADNDSEYDDYSQKSIKDIFDDVPNSMPVPLINSNSDESGNYLNIIFVKYF